MVKYKSKYSKLKATNNREAMKAARKVYRTAQKRTPRRLTYVRSKYFNNDKVFIDQFWVHIEQKNPADQFRRLKLYACALDLIRNNTLSSTTVFSKKNRDIILHKFWGLTRDGETYVVQIRQDKRTNRKYFMSVYPSSQGK